MADGLGLAEDPGNGDSFGMNRCRIVAEGLWSAFQQGLKTEDKKFAAVEKQFEKYGLSLDRPYLNAGSADQYITPGFPA